MKHTTEPRVGLDSQCLTYLLKGIAGNDEPTDCLGGEKKALLRSWFYTSVIFVLTGTVISEARKIPDIDLLELHESFILTHFREDPVRNLAEVEAKAALFEKKHLGSNDCLILAEAVDLGLDLMLTYDFSFLSDFSDASNTTKLRKPTDYWASLDIARGTSPVRVPHHTNPLSEQWWWRW